MRSRSNALVLVLIVAVGGGLLLPAVARVRDAAARTECCNNLHQLALGLQNYADTHNRLPAGTIPNVALPPERRLSWLVDALPYAQQCSFVIERGQGWDAEHNRVPKSSWYDEDQARWREQPLGEVLTFRCPSNPAAAAPGWPGLTHYVGVAGVGRDAATWDVGYPGTGVFGHDRRLGLQDITDGTAATLLVIETTRDNGAWTAGGFPTVRGLDPAGGPYLGQGGQFGSNHRDGRPFVTNAAFADASVRGLTDTIRPEVFEALATVAGGEGVGQVGDE
jgi:hypothetical protein